MIVTSITSGLGNQMFQYAAGHALARRLGVQLGLDVSFYKTNRYRPLELCRFTLSGRLLSTATQLQLEVDLRKGSRHPLRRAARQVTRCLPLRHFTCCSDVGQAIADSYWQAGDFTALCGYWQNEAYFKDAADELRREFTFRHSPSVDNQSLLNRIRALPAAVCVHVRRGDYLTGKEVLSAAGVEYYVAALRHLGERVPEAHCFVFSDDPDWVRQHLPVAASSTFVTHNNGHNDPEDLRLMMACRHFVIANSTFSWWAPWLSTYEDSVVVAPAKWFSVSHPVESVIVPDRWIRLG